MRKTKGGRREIIVETYGMRLGKMACWSQNKKEKEKKVPQMGMKKTELERWEDHWISQSAQSSLAE